VSTDDASKVYGGQVSEIIAGAARESSYQPDTPVELFVKDRRTPQTVDELEPIERLQLERMFRGEDLARVLREGIEDLPIELEIAMVVDDAGTPRYRLYGWNFGVAS
jgi:hypothetical protein